MIIYACQDLIFATKIRSTAETLGVVTRPARDARMLQNRLNQVDDGKANDPVTGVIIDLETGDTGMAMLEQTKQFDNSLPIVAFGSHVATAVLRQAKARGADQVLPRSAFTVNLPQLLEQLDSS